MTSAVPVPAYVHGSDRGVAQLYLAANGATAKIGESNASTTYLNPGTHKALQRVVVSRLPDARENLAQAFQNAWTTVFSRNYRLYMTQTESYSQGFDPNNHTEPWELEPYVMYDELGVRYEAVTEELSRHRPVAALRVHPAESGRRAAEVRPVGHHAARQRQRPAHPG